MNDLPEGLSAVGMPSAQLRPNADPRAHEIQLVDGKGAPHYRGEVTQEGGGLWGVGYVENLSQQFRGLAIPLYRAMAKYVEDRGGTLVGGMNTNRASQAVHQQLMDAGLAEPLNIGGRDLLKIKSSQ